MTHWRASAMPPISSESSQDLKRFCAIIIALLAFIGAIGLTYAALAAHT